MAHTIRGDMDGVILMAVMVLIHTPASTIADTTRGMATRALAPGAILGETLGGAIGEAIQTLQAAPHLRVHTPLFR